MIILHGAGAGFGLPEISPYVTKAEVQLQMAGLSYQKTQAMPDQSPKGQIPFIRDGAEVIADSTFIRAYLEEKYSFDLDEGLSPRQRAEAWAIERMLENHFSWAVAYTRWLLPENFAKGPAHFFDFAPEEAREALRAEVVSRVTDTVRAVGIGRHTHDEIIALGDRSLLALSELLGRQRYLFGDRPVGVDATAFGLLAAVLTPFFPSQLRDRVLEYPNLVAYVERMMRLHYPDHAWPGQRSAVHVEKVD